MTVNLNKHRDELLAAWKDVCNEKTSTNWALFGYEKQSNDLMVIDKGDGGLEELGEELNSAKIMYAYCRVVDPNTGLPKFLFINWQGEGAPITKKGNCASHLNEICNFFKGAHVTVNARSEDDVEPSFIMETIAKSGSSQFNFKDRSDPQENTTPVGSVYKRIQPAKEIDAKEREKFWMKEQEEEKKRIQEEKKKAEVERSKREQELRERELREARAREERVVERSLSISKVREAEQNAENTARNVKMEKMQWERQLQQDAQEEAERRKRSESLRKERSQEAQRMISRSTINSAKAIFEQNTCAGQMSSISSAKAIFEQNICTNQTRAPVKISTRHEETVTSVPATQPVQAKETMKVPSPEPARLAPVASQQTPPICTSPISQLPPEEFNYTRNLLKDGLPPRQESEVENQEEEQNWDEPTLEAPPDVKDPLTEILAERGIQPPQQYSQGSPQVITSGGGQGLRARALYDYQAADDTEISFDPDDLITHIEQIDEGWWQGMGPDGSYGLFPANYVELVD